MTIKTREASAPITDGEGISAADVENEFVKLFALQNGDIDTTNISATAGILGTQMANNTIAEAQVTASTLTTASMAASAVIKSSFNTSTNAAGPLTTSLTMVDVPGASSITLTPGSTSDIVVMELQIATISIGGSALHAFGFNIDDGTGDVEMGLVFGDSNSTSFPKTSTIRHVMTATAASSTTYKPIYRYTNSGTDATTHRWYDTGVDYNTLFSVTIYPIK
jgi:hypothetical protein